ncbi:MAG: DUF11 domain-containing protein [Pyrinomonadaceae bacterium]|nr:DUF11 domain-containing protein [Pyrinomonadaceae bacterium]
MKNLVSRSVFALSLLSGIVIFGSISVAAAPPAPNLSVLAWQGSSSPTVESPYQYSTRVRNIGNQTAQGVTLTVTFPLTNTSPSQFILGKLTSVQTSGGTCSVVANKIQCSFGNLSQNQTRTVTFNFEFQVASTQPTMTTTVASSSLNEKDPYNNLLAFTPSLQYPDNVITAGNYMVTSCTGRGLTSFYECEQFPSSQQSFTAAFDLGGTIAIPQAPDYNGFWDQNSLPLNKTLHFTIMYGSVTEAEFNGFAVSSTCFEGLTVFPGNTTYNSAYRVCRQ